MFNLDGLCHLFAESPRDASVLGQCLLALLLMCCICGKNYWISQGALGYGYFCMGRCYICVRSQGRFVFVLALLGTNVLAIIVSFSFAVPAQALAISGVSLDLDQL